MRRGEVWTASGRGHYAGKPRPAVIVRSDLFDRIGSVTLCGLTSLDVPEARELRPAVAPRAENGLARLSYVMIDKVTTLPADQMGERIGALSAAELAEVDEALALFLGLASPSVPPLTSERARD